MAIAAQPATSTSDVRMIRLSTSLRRSVQPLGCVALQVEVHAAPAIRPAHVGDRDEERRRQAIERADLAGQQRGVAAEAHRADAGLVRLLHDALLERAELRVVVRVVEEPQELFLGAGVAAAAVAADADAEDAGAAALSLRLQDAVEDRVLDAIEIAVAEVGMRE